MTSTTARHRLPLLAPGQAQKELFHNESLAAIDALLHPCVEAIGPDAPPGAAEEGRSWIVGNAPTGAWAGKADALATWTGGGWRFCAPAPGMRVTVRESGVQAAWDGNAWKLGHVQAVELIIDGERVVGPRKPGIDAPSGGTTIDFEARATLSAMLGALRGHGLIA